MRGREFPPPLLPSQLLIEKNESGNQIQDGGGEVDVGVGLAAVLFCPLAHGVHPLSVYNYKRPGHIVRVFNFFRGFQIGDPAGLLFWGVEIGKPLKRYILRQGLH